MTLRIVTWISVWMKKLACGNTLSEMLGALGVFVNMLLPIGGITILIAFPVSIFIALIGKRRGNLRRLALKRGRCALALLFRLLHLGAVAKIILLRIVFGKVVHVLALGTILCGSVLSDLLTMIFLLSRARCCLLVSAGFSMVKAWWRFISDMLGWRLFRKPFGPPFMAILPQLPWSTPPSWWQRMASLWRQAKLLEGGRWGPGWFLLDVVVWCL